MRDELNEGDQILVKVLGVEGNKIKLRPQGDSPRTAREDSARDRPDAPGEEKAASLKLRCAARIAVRVRKAHPPTVRHTVIAATVRIAATATVVRAVAPAVTTGTKLRHPRSPID